MGCAYFEFDQLRSAGKFFEFLSKVTLTSRGAASGCSEGQRREMDTRMDIGGTSILLNDGLEQINPQRPQVVVFNLAHC